MSDSILNSVHLEFPRRDAFRQARQQLLDARGFQTLALEAPRPVNPSDTLADLLGGRPRGAQGSFVLMEHGRRHPLKVGLNTVGRLKDNDVIVSDAHVSRRHCAILVHASQCCEVHDTASKNGTFLNGQRITCPTPLKPGDQIRMCDHELVLERWDAAEEQAQAATR